MATKTYIHFDHTDPKEVTAAFEAVCDDGNLDPAETQKAASQSMGKRITLEHLAYAVIKIGGTLTLKEGQSEIIYP